MNNPTTHPNRYAVFGIVCILLVLTLSSCVTQKDVEYLQDPVAGPKSFESVRPEDYRLKPNDELYIQINSLDDPSASITSAGSSVQMMSMGTIQPYGASLISYTIDKDGFLLLPVIGKIQVRNMTTAHVSDTITQQLRNILSQPMVTVKLVNRFVSVLGEVFHPGHYSYSQEKMTIFDAIGLAGDITDFGNKSEVILTRNEDGKNTRIPLDLSKSEILASEYYYIQPNDIIYIKPMPKKFWNMREFPFTVIFSTITTAILVYTVVR
jgi:polysaccharide export outer membrane protein